MSKWTMPRVKDQLCEIASRLTKPGALPRHERDAIAEQLRSIAKSIARRKGDDDLSTISTEPPT